MSTDPTLNDPALRGRAVAAAQGHSPFDLLISGGTVLDMVTGEARAADVGIVGALIASVHSPDPARVATARMDARDMHILPGFIDTHMHVESSMVTPATYAAHIVPRGVTTVVWDPHELANVAGLTGMEYALRAADAAALRILPLVPTCVPSAPGFEISGADFDARVVGDLLARADTHGAAEMMTMQPLLSGSPRVKAIVDASVASGKRVCGHGRGLGARELNAYAAAGIETDHELGSAADLLDRIRAGFTVELRGSHAHLLPEFSEALLALGHMPQSVTLCTDDVFADDLWAQGGLDQVMRRLIALGLPPVWGYQAATLNAARAVGRKDLGLIAPGRRADLVLVSDLEAVRVHAVVMNGALVAERGQICASNAELTVPTPMMQSVDVAPLSPADFDVRAEGRKAQIATLCKPRFPVWGRRTLDVRDGKVVVPDDMIRMGVMNRHGCGTPMRVALMEDWGRWRGAFATTVSHDSHNLTVFGSDPADMAAAANAVRASQGGLAVARDGCVVAELPLPVAGLMQQTSLEDVARALAALRAAMDEIVEWEPPYLVFKALFGASLVCNAGPRLSDVGLVDVFEGLRMESCVLLTGADGPRPQKTEDLQT